MSATDRTRLSKVSPPSAIAATLALVGAAGIGFAAVTDAPVEVDVAGRITARLPKTPITKVDCAKIDGLCEVTAGSNLFYTDRRGRYLVIGRVYDLETRQDLTAARILELNPDLLVGGAVRANAEEKDASAAAAVATRTGQDSAIRRLPLAKLSDDGAIVWGTTGGPTVTVFTDFRCSYCRALASELGKMNVRVVERPISVLGSRDLANRVYCARDRVRALHAAYAGERIESAGSCDTTGLDANERFARDHGLGGTPVIVRSDGAMIEGFRPRAVLEAWLAEPRS